MGKHRFVEGAAKKPPVLGAGSWVCWESTMFDLLIGNFGKRNSVQNGQSQKAIQVYRLFEEHMNIHPRKIDSGNYMSYALSFAQALHRQQSVALCVGPKGIRLASLLFSALGPSLPRRPSITLFVVGGWLPHLATRAGDVKRLCHASRVLVEAQGLRDELAALGIESEIFPNFRDLPIQERSRNYDPDNIRLIYCGRISTAKGAGRALDLLRELRRYAPRTRLDFYGPIETPEFSGLIDRAAGATYQGTFDDISSTTRIFPEYDFLVLPSAYSGECIPGAVVEAMFAGLPSIVSKWRFLPEIVIHEQSGFVFDLEQFGNKAAQRISMLMPSEYITLSNSCTDEASTSFSTENAVTILLKRQRSPKAS